MLYLISNMSIKISYMPHKISYMSMKISNIDILYIILISNIGYEISNI